MNSPVAAVSHLPPLPLRVRPEPPRLRGGHRLGLLEGGGTLFPVMAQAMDAARTSVHLETYIFDFQGAPLQVAEALERAALRGVAVRLVVDGVGTPSLPVEWITRFERAGVRWRVYAPLGRLGLLLPSRWRRLHRKLCVVDGVLGFCGGINLIDDHWDGHLGALSHPRLDFAVRCTGPLVETMADSMLQLWWRLQAARKVRQGELRAAWEALRVASPLGDFSDWSLPGQTESDQTPVGTVSTLDPVDNAAAMLVLRDNIWHRADIEKAYLKAVSSAKHEVLLANAYFVPGRRLVRALAEAVQRGVRVRVLLQGQYEGFMQYHAARPVYKRLLDAGVGLYEYGPSALHAKVAVVDGRWATVGSSNLDPLSLLLAREANVVSTEPAFAAALQRRLDHVLTHEATPISHMALLQRPWRHRLLDQLAFAIMRGLLFLTGHRY